MSQYHSNQSSVTRMIRDFQRRHGLTVDGKDGPITWAKVIEVTVPKNEHDSNQPNQPAEKLASGYRSNQLSQASMKRKYGEPGDESKLVTFKMPFPMKLYGGETILISHRCHLKVKEKLELLLQTWLDELGIDYIRQHRLDHFYGCYNNRNTRGGSTKSRHAWGIAIDIDASNNGNKTPWSPDKVGQRGYATMPIAAINIANRLDWISGATAWGRDAMHFQAD